jgi:hypothetical protein
MTACFEAQRSFNLMRRKTDVTFAANPQIYYQDLFSNLKQNNKKSFNTNVKPT